MSKFWNDITSHLPAEGTETPQDGVETGGLPDIPTPSDIEGAEALGQATGPRWGTPTYDAATRKISAVLTLDTEPGSAFSLTDDFEVQERSGTAGNYTWTADADWTFAELPRFGSFTQTALYEDTAYDQTITAAGSPTPTITSRVTSGVLPGNMTLTGARLHSTGNPEIVEDAGTTFSITFTATNAAGSVDNVVNYTITRNRLPVFDDVTFSDVILTGGTAYDRTFTATGVPTPTITSRVTFGTLPTGLTLVGGRLHGNPSGIPDAGTTFSVTFTATSGANTVDKVVGFFVNNAAPSVPANRYAAPSFNAFTPAALTEGMATNQTITASGNPTPTITSEASDSIDVKVFYVEARGASQISYQSMISPLVKSIQSFFATQMNSHGYGRQTFDLDENAMGVVTVHKITLPRIAAEYRGTDSHVLQDLRDIVDADTTGRFPRNGLSSFFVNLPGTYFTFNGFATLITHSHPRIGVIYTTSGRSGFPGQGSSPWNWQIMAHELGHCLGLFIRLPFVHNTAYPTSLMHTGIYGSNMRLLQQNAEILNDTRAFGSGTGSIPTGLTLNGATLSGTPAVGTAGTFTVAFTATSTAGTDKRIVTFTIGT